MVSRLYVRATCFAPRGAFGGDRAFVFERTTAWNQTQQLDGGHWVGWSVALEGDLAVLGGNTEARVFRRSAGTFRIEQTLTGGTGCFGCATQISDQRVFVGAHGDSTITVFDYTDHWASTTTLHGGDHPGFGFKLDVEATTLAASAVDGERGTAYAIEVD